MKTFLFLLIGHLVFAAPIRAQTSAAQSSGDYVVVAFDWKHLRMVPYAAGITLFSAIASGGDFDEFAGQRFVCLIRGGKKQRIDLKALRRDPTKDSKLEPWDIIYLSETLF